VVCLVHGLGEHSGRYGHVAARLVEAGYAVLAVDLRGHGQSPGQRGDAPSYDSLLDDVDSLLAEAMRRHPGTSQFLYGHSLGGALVLNYCLRRRPALAGAIATASLLRLAFAPSAGKRFTARLLNRVWPTLSLSNELDPNDLSRDPVVVRAYRADPLVHDRLSVRLGVAILEAGHTALANAREIAVPVLVMHGGSDRITSADASDELARLAGSSASFKRWDKLYHEIHNEPEQVEVLACVVSWLDERLAEWEDAPQPPAIFTL
jgi:alpha-beta hydrolase superfamily lysophospholipase